MMPASPAPWIAIAVARARRSIRTHFLAHHAISVEDAVAYVPQRPLVRSQFERMQRKGIVREAGSGRYWLDAAAYEADAARRRRVIIPAALLAVLAAAAIPLLFYQG